jgi:hypothetical protein
METGRLGAPPLAVALVLGALLAGSCGGSTPPVARPATPIPSSAGIVLPGHGSYQPSTAPPVPAPVPSVAASPVAGAIRARVVGAARSAFDQWLRALVGDDAKTLLDRSVGAAAALGALQMVTNQIIEAEGEATTARLIAERLSPSRVTSNSVTFAGTVEYREVTSRSQRHFSTLDRISGPVELVQDANGWRVSDFSFAAAPMRYYAEGIMRAVQGAHLTIAYVLETGAGTSVLVGFSGSASGERLYLHRLTLVLASGRSVEGRAFFAHGMATGILGFPRSGVPPVRLILGFRRSDGSAVDFSVPLRSRPS